MQQLRANTQVIVTIGPFVDVGDGFTPETAITLGAADEAELLKHGSATVVSLAAATWAAVNSCDGYYSLTLTTAHTDTEGMLLVVINDDSVCLPVKHEFHVLSEAAWDSLYAAKDTGFMDINVKAVSEDTAAADNLELACDNYSATRGLTGTALPAAASDAAGGVPVSDVGGLDLDALNTSAVRLTAVRAQVLDDWINAGRLDAILDIVAADVVNIDGAAMRGTDSGATAVELSKVPKSDSTVTWNATALASINTQADTALSDYDAPTKTEMDSAFTEIKGATWASGTDTLEALRDRGDAAWVTGGGTGLTALGSGTAQSGTASTIVLSSGSTYADDVLNGNVIKIHTGTGAGQARVIVSNTLADDTCNVTPSWTTNPSSDSQYEMVEGSSNVVAMLLDAQTIVDLKDFADAGYDPGTNKVQGVVLADTVTTLTGHTAQTADHAAEIAKVPKSDGTVTWNATALASFNAEADTALSDYDAPTNTEMTAAFTEIKGATWASSTDTLEALRDRGDAAWVTGGGTGLTALGSGTSQSGTGSTIVLAAVSAFADDVLNGNVIKIHTGTGAGQARVIVSNTLIDDTCNVTPDWITNPGADSQYEIVEGSGNVVAMLLDAQTITDLKDFADAGYDPGTNKVQGVVLTDTVTTNTDMRGTDSAATAAEMAKVPKSDGTSSWNATALGAINTQADTALTDYDPPTMTELATAFTEVKGATWASGTDTLEAIRDRGDDAWTTGAGGSSGLTALGSGTAQSGTSSTIVLAAVSAFADNVLNGNVIKIHTGTGAGQARLIKLNTLSDDTCNITPAWAVSPSSDSEYEIVEGSGNVVAMLLDDQSVTDLKDFADAGYDPAINKVQGVVLADTINALGAQAKLDVNTEADTALTDYAAPTKTEMDAAFTEIKGATWSAGTDTIEHIRNKQTDIESDTNELQTDLTNGGRLDLLIDAILADTGEIQTDWVNGGRLDLIADAILADTNEVQTDLADGGRLDLLIDATLADTNELQTDLTNGGRLDLLIDGVKAVTDALTVASATKLALSAGSMTLGTVVAGTLSTTQMTSDLTTYGDNHYNDSLIVWLTGGLAFERSEVTTSAQSAGLITHPATTLSPEAGDTFMLL